MRMNRPHAPQVLLGLSSHVRRVDQLVSLFSLVSHTVYSP